MVDADLVQFVRPLKGAAASVLVALLACGGNMTQLELQHVTGYSDKPIAAGLAVLEALGTVQFHGRLLGWSLSRQYSFSLRPAQLEAASDEGKMGRGEDLDGNIPNSGKIPISSPSSSSSSLSLNGDLFEEEERNARKSEIFDVLQLAGVGRRSPKMRHLLSLNLDPGVVSAWVSEFLAHAAGVSRDRDVFTVGTLIHILECGDPAPVRRCFDCHYVDCLCGVIRK